MGLSYTQGYGVPVGLLVGLYIQHTTGCPEVHRNFDPPCISGLGGYINNQQSERAYERRTNAMKIEKIKKSRFQKQMLSYFCQSDLSGVFSELWNSRKFPWIFRTNISWGSMDKKNLHILVYPTRAAPSISPFYSVRSITIVAYFTAFWGGPTKQTQVGSFTRNGFMQGGPVPRNNGYEKMVTLVLRFEHRKCGKFKLDFTKSSVHHLIVFIAQNIYFL